MRFSVLSVLPLLFSVLVVGCSSSTSPTADARVTGIIPSSGSTLGNTAVTITGQNFSSAATVTVGGSALTQLTFVSSTTLTGVTTQHAAGMVNVVVSQGTQTAAQAVTYTYVAPAPVVNAPPVILSIAAAGAGPNEPKQFASLDEAINVSAVVTDAETPVSQLTFAWTADAGTYLGNGPSVTWIAPHVFPTPTTATLTLTVTEKFASTDASGLPVTGENVVKGVTGVRVHNSVQEVSDIATQYLLDFSKQVDVNVAMRNFTNSCIGTAFELHDIQVNQQIYVINTYFVGTPATTVSWTGVCPFRSVQGDACAQVPVEWHSTVKATGASEVVMGTDQMTAVFENDQWRLCASDFNGFQLAGSRFIR